MNKKIIIIGSGIGSLTAGALLTKNGFKVEIFEKESIIGGRALTFDTSKLTLDLYLKILKNYNMFVPFSFPDLKTIFNNKMLTSLYNMFININLSDMETCYKMFHREIIQDITVVLKITFRLGPFFCFALDY